MRYADAITARAISYVGQREIPPNRGFQDKEFERQMRAIGGWRPGWAWCACFTRLVWLEAGEWTPEEATWLRSALQPGVLNTWRAFDGAGRISQKPQRGAIAFWRNGHTQFGHAGIVTLVARGGVMETVEGNTNEAGGREGDAVAKKTRRVDFTRRARGLWLLGFGVM